MEQSEKETSDNFRNVLLKSSVRFLTNSRLTQRPAGERRGEILDAHPPGDDFK